MKLIYKDKTYTLDELHQERLRFEKQLLKTEYLILKDFFEFACLDPSYKLTVDLFRDLYSQISSARFALLLGFKKLHDSNKITWDSGEIGQYWLRFQYLKNSINWYNSCFDILLQIPWFLFSLYNSEKTKNKHYKKDEIDSVDSFRKLQNKCRWRTLKTALEEIGTKDALELLKALRDFYNLKTRKVVNTWANSLKHNGRFEISELYRPGLGLVVGKYSSEFTKPIVVNIDDIIIELKNFHNEFSKLTNFVFDFSNIEKLIKLQKEKSIPFNIKEEKELKRITID